MKKESQKLKVSKVTFFTLNDAMSLVGKKIFGDDWSFENSINKLTSEDQIRFLKTTRTTDSLIKNNFFEIQKSDGQKILPNDQIIFIVDGKVNVDFKVPKAQLDYTLETGKRFCDQSKAKFPQPLIYSAPFKPTSEEVISKFNKKEAGKIKDAIQIKDFGYWLKQNDLSKDQTRLVMLGINPEYFDFLSFEEKRAIDNNCVFLDNDKSGLQLSDINDFIESFKHLEWQNNWDELVKNLYIKSPILNPTFATRCSKFLSYLSDTKSLPTHFDHYRDHTLYRPNYDEYFKKEKELDHEDAAFLAMGLEPKYAKRYLEYAEVIDADSQRRYSSLGDDEKVFFYKSYWGFLDSNFIFIGRANSIIKRSNYEGDLEKFFTDLHNEGFLLNEHLAEYLKRKKKFPKYDQNSKLYTLLNFLSQMRYWTLDDVYNLTMDKNPIDGEQIIFPLGRQCSDGFHVYQSHDKKTYSVLLKAQEFCDIKKIDQFYPKEGEGYRPQDILEWLIKHTLVGVPDLLVDLTFKNGAAADKKKLTALKKIMTNNKIEAANVGRPTTIDYPKVWEIFVTEILEGEFDKDRSSHEQQAKVAFDKLEEGKQNKLREDGRTNLAQNILSKCKDKTEIGRTMIVNKIIAPFEDEFSEKFFQ